MPEELLDNFRMSFWNMSFYLENTTLGIQGMEMTVSVIWLICMFEIYIVNALMNLAPALKVPSMSSLIVPKQFTE